MLAKGYAEYFLRKEHPEATLVSLPSMMAIAKALVDDIIDALAGDHPMMGYEVGKLGKSSSLVLKEIIYIQALVTSNSLCWWTKGYQKSTNKNRNCCMGVGLSSSQKKVTG